MYTAVRSKWRFRVDIFYEVGEMERKKEWERERGGGSRGNREEKVEGKKKERGKQ